MKLTCYIHSLGLFQAVVTDGITLGRPCCKEHNCPNELPNNRAHWCLAHSHLAAECVVVACKKPAETGYHTCSIPEHRALEATQNEKNKAFFQLRQQLKRQLHDTSQLADSVGELPAIDWEDEDVHKSDKGNTQPKARFARH